ncbi:MAG: arsenate reductase ArsC [Planctomycetales bacterium]
MKPKVNVLFLCTGNSCRSQMAEGWCRALRGDMYEAYSAGVEPQGMNPRAVQVMREAGIDLSQGRSKHLSELAGINFDVVITVCGHARETCPVLPGVKMVHVPFDDPPRLAESSRSEEEVLGHYRRVRDEIRAFIESREFESKVKQDV